MTKRTKLGRQPSTRLLDFLLADIVIRLQLSSTAHLEAVGHYRAIQSWINRDESPLRGFVECCYPQGSMAIQATVASRNTTDEHDLDIVAELKLPPGISPEIPVNLLYKAIKGQPGSMYSDKVRRRSRCVTVSYRKMHLDITPSVLLPSGPPRESMIFHHPLGSLIEQAQSIIANPFGFAEWFKSRNPVDEEFADAFARQVLDHRFYTEKQVANETTVPNQDPVERKSIMVIVLQLLKRWRNVKYESRPVRRPPSAMIAALVAEADVSETSLLAYLTNCACHILDRIGSASNHGERVNVNNPVCKDDCFTDRWPESLRHQDLFVADLRNFVAQLQALRQGVSLDNARPVLANLFGESPTQGAIEAFNRRAGESIQSGRSRYDPSAGRFVIPTAAMPTQPTAQGSQQTASHTFYGSED